MKKILFAGLLAFTTSTPAWSAWIHDWSRSLGNTGFDAGMCIATDQNNLSISAGVFTGTVDFNADPCCTANLTEVAGTATDMYILRKNHLGAFNWVKQVGGTGQAFPESIIVQSGGGDVYVCGRFYGQVDFNMGATPAAVRTSSGGIAEDIFIARYNAITGALVWVNVFGSTGQDGGCDVHFDGAGNVLMTGYFQGTVNFATGAGKNNLASVNNTVDVFFARYAMATGTAGWTRVFGGPGIDKGLGICTDAASFIYLCGLHQSSTIDVDPGTTTFPLTLTGTQDAFFGRYVLGTGNFSTWCHSFGASGVDNKATDIAYNNDLVAPQINLTGFVNGTVTFPSGGPSYTSSARDAYLLSYSPAGGYLWGNGFPGSAGGEEGTDIARSGNYVYVCGYFENTVDFDIAGTSVTATSAGLADVFMLRYREDGVFMDVAGMGSTGVDVAMGISAFNAPNVTNITGYFNGTVDFDPDAVGVANRTSLGGDDIFHNRYSWTTPVRIADPGTSTALVPYPNPASGAVWLNDVESGSLIELYSTDGRLCGSWQAAEDGNMQIDLSNQVNGVYIMRMRLPDGALRNERIVVRH